MAELRSFEDPSPEARALDAIGERWALLVVRELMFGPRRFGDLRRALPRASQSVLSTRLKELTENGAVTQDLLAGSLHYTLTERGFGLRPTLIELCRWGHDLPILQAGGASPAATFLELQAWWTPDSAALGSALVLRLGNDSYRLQSRSRRLTIALSSDERDRSLPRLATDVATFRSLVFGTMTLPSALDHHLARLDGDPEAIYSLLSSVSRPRRDGLRTDGADRPAGLDS
jgi:DNA-binding HxlR family transcriptional regulator